MSSSLFLENNCSPYFQDQWEEDRLNADCAEEDETMSKIEGES